MHLLISNDDGIFSPGIRALAEVASEFGEVRIVAPDVEQSAMSHAVTLSRPLNYHRTPLDKFAAYRVNGTPADCVALGAFHWEKVDVVLSGINLGLNIGNAMWHSGTLAAAKQAALLGLRGIAFSAPTAAENRKYDKIKPYLRQVLNLLLHEFTMDLVNVNFPLNPKGIRWTKQSVRHYDGNVIPGKDPLGKEHYWFTVIEVEEVSENTDRWAVEHDYVSLTPLRLDLTDHQKLEQARSMILFPK